MLFKLIQSMKSSIKNNKGKVMIKFYILVLKVLKVLIQTFDIYHLFEATNSITHIGDSNFGAQPKSI